MTNSIQPSAPVRACKASGRACYTGACKCLEEIKERQARLDKGLDRYLMFYVFLQGRGKNNKDVLRQLQEQGRVNRAVAEELSESKTLYKALNNLQTLESFLAQFQQVTKPM